MQRCLPDRMVEECGSRPHKRSCGVLKLEAGPNTVPGLSYMRERISPKSRVVGWGGRIRTSAWWNQNPLPYHLATPQQCQAISCTKQMKTHRAYGGFPANRTGRFAIP